jgi:ornithine cyclodeaminase/alanine dehydrogenase-like protein (mu-crystallin family)
VSSEPDLRVVSAEELRDRLPMPAAVDALEEAFRTLDPGAGPLRTNVETPRGSLLLMPAFGEAGVGVKLVALTPANPERGRPFIQASYVLFDAETQTPEAVLDGTALTALRTAAVSALATRHLAREDASRLVVFGAGVEARSHLEAMCAVRQVTDLVVVSRSPGPAEDLAQEGLDRGIHARLGQAGDVAEADLVCTCTTSEAPLFDGSLLPPGAHVNAVGAHRPETRELDTDTVRRARLVVETRAVALAEAGDLLIPIAEGTIEAGHVAADLAETVRGARVRRSPDDVTVFKSVGMAFEDLAVARAIVDAGR